LAKIGFEGFIEIKNGFEAYIQLKNYNERDILKVLLFKQKYDFRIDKIIIEDKNWNKVWEKRYFKPLVVSDELVVRAPFHKKYPRLKYEIVIEPGIASSSRTTLYNGNVNLMCL
jgi:ribosomal protein L11 methyltransferase